MVSGNKFHFEGPVEPDSIMIFFLERLTIQYVKEESVCIA
jgi:hypothetical protein